MDINVGQRDKSSGIIVPFERVSSYGDGDYALIKECLLQHVKESDVYEDEDGLTLSNQLLASGRASIKDYRRACEIFLRSVKVYGSNSKELSVVSLLICFPRKNNDIGNSTVLLPTIRTKYKIARDANGCFMGVCTLGSIRTKWPDAGYADGVIVVNETIGFEVANTFVKSTKVFPYFESNIRASRSVIDACKNVDFARKLGNSEEYWQSQIDIAWDVLFEDDKPVCTVPYTALIYALGYGWFCSGPHTVQMVPNYEAHKKIEFVKRVASRHYEAIGHAGEVCKRRTEDARNGEPIFAYGKIATDTDGLACVYDSNDLLLGLFSPKAIIKTFRVVFPVEGGYKTYDCEEKYKALRNKKIITLLKNSGISSAHKKLLISLLKTKESIIRVIGANKELMGFYKVSYVWSKWKVLKYKSQCAMISSFTDEERLKQLNHCIKTVGGLSDAQRQELSGEIRVLESAIENARKQEIINTRIRVITNVTTSYLVKSYSMETATRAIKLLERYANRKYPNAIAIRVSSVLEDEGCSSISLGGLELTPRDLAARVWEGDKEAIELVADIVARGIQAAETSQPEPESKPAFDDDIPEWARPQRAYVIEWAERTISAEQQLRDQPATLYVASQIKAGKADVLVFDCPLYQEVVAADMEGRLEYDAASWPYPVSIIRLVGVEGVHGVAVCRVSDVNRYARKRGLAQLAESGGLCSFFIGDATGAVEAGPGARAEADRLITYLDCDNANVDTIYVDGGPRQYQQSGGQAPPQDDVEYRVGADYVTGDRIVVERDREHGAMRQVRKAHFRRGFYRRSRIGPRDKWHYEVRWVKPTFVHGAAKQSVTEHKVTRIVLRPIDVEKDDK